MKLKALALLAAATWVAPADPAAAQHLPLALSDAYRITSWVGGDGITLGEVRSIVQDGDGYLWMGTDAGLVRFDGSRFTTVNLVSGDTPLPAAPTRAVYLARDGSFWVGYGEGHGIYHIVAGAVRDIHLENRIPRFVNHITEDRAGALWVAHDQGLYRLWNGRWEQVALPDAPAGVRVLDVHEDRAGAVWVAAASGLYRQYAGGAFEKAPYSDGPARAISEDAAGRVWTTDEARGFRPADTSDRNSLFESRGMNLLHDRKGNLWVATIGQGLWQVPTARGPDAAATVRRATVQSGLVSDESSDMLEDRDGNIWVGSIRGLNRLTPHKVMSLLDIGVVNALALGDNGTAWAGTTNGLVALTGVTGRAPGASRIVSGAAIRTLHAAADGTVWAATNTGLHRLEDGQLVPVAPTGPPLNRITSIASDRHGTLWVCDRVLGVVRVVGGRVERVTLPTTGTSTRPIFTHIDTDDRAWIAFEGGAVKALDRDGRMVEFGPSEGLSHATVTAIHHDRRGDIWVTGNLGASRLRGKRFHTLTSGNGLPERSVMAVMDDEVGDIWLAIGYFGFLRLTRDEVERGMGDPAYRVRYRVYDTSDGAGYPDGFYFNNAAMAPGGALWFVTSRGLTVLDPRSLRTEPGAPVAPPRIEGVWADDHYYGTAEGATLPPQIERLRIDYTVVSLSSPDRTQFRYRLDGFDTNWVDGTGPRQASYTKLPPGRYRFRLQAANNLATWEDAEAAWSFSIQPMFYQTRWFYALCALALALVAIGAWQLRMRHVRREIALVFGERLRLSREIHDTVLQSLVGIALQLDSASYDLRDGSARTRTQLVGMRRQIEEYIRETRQAIWNLRSPALDHSDLVGALRSTGEKLTAGNVHFALTVTGTARPCPAHLETHVLRIGHEAVINAVRHGQARHVRMEVGFDTHLLRLLVADDGRGFDPRQLPGSGSLAHYGLLSMQERAADAGGRCTIESTPGSGVQVVAEFPLTSPA
jgi:ligand-binding sensor domain-containing protein